MKRKNISRCTVPALRARKEQGQRITALTAYDYQVARLLDAAGVDLILVGDSLGTVVQGHTTTIPVTLEEVCYHCRCVVRGVERALVVGDLPFLSYQVSPEQAVASAGQILKEGGAAAVKLEGGLPVEATIARLTAADIPVVGHVGLTPQSYHRMGGHRQQGRVHDQQQLLAGSRERILADAEAVARAGAFAIVIEGVPADLAAEITASVPIPTIGIAAGPHCDGQILVVNDLLGLDPAGPPPFVQPYADLAGIVTTAVERYCEEVVAGCYPPSIDKTPKSVSMA